MRWDHGFVVVGAVACAWAAGCTSSSNGAPPGAGADAGTASSGSGSSSGSSSGGGSGSSSGSSSGGGSGSSSGSSSGGGSGGDATVIASGLSDPVGLVVVGNALYWVEQSGGASAAIKSVATSGGTPSTVLAKAGLDGNLGTDGTSLYYSAGDGSTSEVDKVGLDGSNPTPLAGNITTETTEDNSGRSALYVTGGNVYVQTSAKIGVVPVGGGALASASGTASAPSLFWGDSSGLYVTAIDLGDAGSPGLDIDVFPLTGGGAPVVLRSDPVAAQSAILEAITQAGGSVYLVMQDHGASPTTSSLLKGSPSGGAPATVGTYSDFDIEDIAADGAGIYVTNRRPSTGPGVYAIPLAGGAATLVQSSDVTDIEPRTVVVDAGHVYWISGGYNAGQALLHAKAR